MAAVDFSTYYVDSITFTLNQGRYWDNRKINKKKSKIIMFRKITNELPR